MARVLQASPQRGTSGRWQKLYEVDLVEGLQISGDML
jgi:hypothetical protein